MQLIDTQKALAIPPVFRLGFRPFFLLSACLAVVAIVVWVGVLLGGWALPAPLGGWLAWHRHEMVFGFAGGVVAGFLLTAVQTWTEQPSVSGKPLAALVVLWLLARTAWWWPQALPLLELNVLFWLMVASVMTRLLWAVRQNRNYPIAVVLLILAAMDAFALSGVLQNNDAWQRQGSLAAVWLVVAMITLIAGRVMPFFTARGLGKPGQVAAWPWLDWPLLVGAVLMAVVTATGSMTPGQYLVGGVLLLLAAGHAVRVVRWFDPGVLRVPLLWSLFLAYAWLIVGCLSVALWVLNTGVPESQAWHALTVGAVGGLILAMMARVSLGHTGRPLTLPSGFFMAFVLLNVSAVLRVFGPSVAYSVAIWASAIFWCLAFVQFVAVYGPMLCKTRVDGRPG